MDQETENRLKKIRSKVAVRNNEKYRKLDPVNRKKGMIYNINYFPVLRYFLMNTKERYCFRDIETIINKNTWSSKLKPLLRRISLIDEKRQGQVHFFDFHTTKFNKMLFDEYLKYVTIKIIETFMTHRVFIKEWRNIPVSLDKKSSYVKDKLDKGDTEVLKTSVMKSYNDVTEMYANKLREQFHIKENRFKVNKKGTLDSIKSDFYLKAKQGSKVILDLKLMLTYLIALQDKNSTLNPFGDLLLKIAYRKIYAKDRMSIYEVIKKSTEENYSKLFESFVKDMKIILTENKDVAFCNVFDKVIEKSSEIFRDEFKELVKYPNKFIDESLIRLRKKINDKTELLLNYSCFVINRSN